MAKNFTQWDPKIRLSDTIKLDDLEITFHRTVRVPDNFHKNKLPPSLGQFPLFNVSEHAAKLPSVMAQKGGLFFPMFQREAMWIGFSSQKNYAVKIYSGNVNVISGEPAVETANTSLHRRNLLKKGKTIQDYIVVPYQDWLDGFAVEPGVVRQFVAMPMRTGYSVESQVTGNDTVGGLQFEITRLDPSPKGNDGGEPKEARFIIKLVSNNTELFFKVSHRTRVDELKRRVQKMINSREHPVMEKGGFQLLFDGCRLSAGTTLGDYEGIQDGSVIEWHRECVGGGGGRMPTYPEPQMNLAAGGLIKQGVVELPQRDYQKTNTIAFNVQILNSAAFQQVTGNPPPPSPVSAETYAKSGYPFFSVFEEPTNVAGDDFVAVRSIGQLNGDADPPLQFPLIDANTGVSLASGTVGFLNPDGPKKEFKFAWEITKELGQESNDS
ncbi:Ubiquitin-like domain-containing protein [Fusarium sp. LHS14.1]|nr:Ubiquitin-like domain-containing protein [Fusarium sp. LHS14.1]